MGSKRRHSNALNSRRNKLTEYDMMMDLINTEKHLSHLYEHAIMESTNITIHNTMEEFQHDEHENAYTLFKVMQQKGWYNPAEQNQRLQPKKIIKLKSKKRNQINDFNPYDYHPRSYNNEYPYM